MQVIMAYRRDGRALELISLLFTLLQDSRFGSIASRPARGRGSVQIATSFDDVPTLMFLFFSSDSNAAVLHHDSDYFTC
jgi:hypothetical protein